MRDRQSTDDLLRHFKCAAAPVLDLLYRSGDGAQIAENPGAIFTYSQGRQAELCGRVSNR